VRIRPYPPDDRAFVLGHTARLAIGRQPCRPQSIQVKLNNVQTFSRSSDQYAKHRPQYPPELFAYLSELCQSRDSVWDCATGNGQAAVSFAKYLSQVQATDISAEQLQHRILHPKVQYSMCPAETTPFADLSFDLITVATAVHWFNQEQFHREAERVLKPKGVLAVWTYGYFEIDPKIYEVILTELLNPIDPYWASGNRQVMNGYRDLALPFEEIRDLPTFVLKLEWDLGQLLAYMRTWSAVKRFAAEHGADPVERLEKALKPIWGEPDTIRVVQMPLFVRASRKPA
jgi:SAM-dependent methyltransferase